MTEPVELQGLSIYEFNGLMGRLFAIAPNWAKYLKVVQNKKTNQKMNENGFITEQFETKNGKTHDIADFSCCITGEIYGNTDSYRNSEKYYCALCNMHSKDIVIIKDKSDGIVNLAEVENFIDHVEDDHPTMYKNKEKKK